MNYREREHAVRVDDTHAHCETMTAREPERCCRVRTANCKERVIKDIVSGMRYEVPSAGLVEGDPESTLLASPAGCGGGEI